ncbi:hypothetical protein GYMLUDRAFT_41706 [Collybiopsis luxurians FD-317 M1]|uniref:DUF6533 domain-containing protein n=1 Tax=Collybiopsis luxurians FD-317 M1 TaxID=944289 RepID=A0A0D0BFY1_9AGAR|nr:hypothetical protein GYMLUDRAFT_41706 [Collybiopsis luxurians FD-317 M1]
MSQWNAEDVQTQVNLGRYIEVTQFVILIYDWLLTFEQEVERYWKRDLKRLPAILYFVNRYLTLCGNIPIFVLYFWTPVTRNPELGHQDLDLFAQVLIFVVQLNISALFILRVTALYEGSKRIRFFLCAVVLGMVCNCLVQVYMTDTAASSEIEPHSVLEQIGNVRVFTTYQGRHLTYLWLGIFVFDLCVFSLTLWKTCRLLGAGHIAGGLLNTVMRDGLLYFGIIALSTFANILVFALGSGLIKGLFPTFFNVISSVLMGRLMLNLREVDLDNSTSPTELSGIVFAPTEIHPAESVGRADIELRTRRSGSADP